ncbi:uncharacterized protein ARMOST_21154 [Armillaria ostoyae]|uniref:Uncharacterized protein n=1 Tax=Armillaria ostoyae TaxID=47428 RepID=A0A284S9B7_ARMOS|nr:uncharacterized protein ARMOST_21154 [Armillaria ostoyae]
MRISAPTGTGSDFCERHILGRVHAVRGLIYEDGDFDEDDGIDAAPATDFECEKPQPGYEEPYSASRPLQNSSIASSPLGSSPRNLYAAAFAQVDVSLHCEGRAFIVDAEYLDMVGRPHRSLLYKQWKMAEVMFFDFVVQGSRFLIFYCETSTVADKFWLTSAGVIASIPCGWVEKNNCTGNFDDAHIEQLLRTPNLNSHHLFVQ